MTDRLEITWNLDGLVSSQNYYRDTTTIDPQSLPEPRAVLDGGDRTYVDTDITFGTRYYVRIGSVKNGTEKLSDEQIVRAGIIDPIIGTTSTVNQNVGTLTMAVPAGTAAGDQLLVILRTRADRSFTIPTGWTVLYSTAIPSGSSTNDGVAVYIILKDFSGETSLSFMQNTAAACAGMVISLRGKLGVLGASFTSPLSYTKTKNSSYMLVFTFDNNYPVVSGSATRVSSPAGYTQIGHSYFIATNEYYGIFASKKGLDTSGVQSFAINWPGTTSTQRLVVAIEIKQG